VHAALVGKPTTIDDHLRTQFPSALFRPRGSSSGIDVLVAGCGTGRHPIEVACKYKDAQSPPREVIVRSLVACACKESSPKNVALAVLLGPIGPFHPNMPLTLTFRPKCGACPQPSQPGFLL
jgi:hypothetical protein